MLRWALIFLILAFVAALLGFGGVAAIAMDVAKLLFLVFIVLLIVWAVTGFRRNRGLR